ncbi:MAG: PRC-barrel domain-containing protein [Cyanobacteria bacterium P01_D01_bin.73]
MAAADFPASVAESVLRDRLILDRGTTEELGHVGGFWVDFQAQRVLGIVCQSGFLGRSKQVLPWSWVNAIGDDSVLVTMPKDAPEFNPPQGTYDPIGIELWSDGGNQAGLIVDFEITPESGAVTLYAYRSNGWQGQLDDIYGLPADAILSCGPKRAIATGDFLQDGEPYRPGLGQVLAEFKASLTQGDSIARADWEKVRSRAAEVARDLQNQAQPITDQVTDQAKDIAKRARSKFGRVAAKAQSKLNETQDRLRSVQNQIKQAQSRKDTEKGRGDRREWMDALPSRPDEDDAQTVDTTARPVESQSPEVSKAPEPETPPAKAKTSDDDDWNLDDWAKPDPWQDDDKTT